MQHVAYNVPVVI